MKVVLLLKTAWLTMLGLIAVIVKLRIGVPRHDEIRLSLQPKHLDRYFLGFVRYASRHHTLVIQLDRKILTRIGWNQMQFNYGSQILKVESLRFSFRKKKGRTILIDEDYFHGDVEWRWPLGLHPNFEGGDEQEERLWGSIVYFGTPSEEYSRLFDEEVWGMPNRKRQFEALLKEESELQVYGKLPMSEYVTRVKKAEFVVCLPGFVWPLCHGLYEAIHLGAIPLLHTNYLRLLPTRIHGPLSEFTYDSIESLLALMKSLSMSDDGSRFEDQRSFLREWSEEEFGQETIKNRSMETGQLLLLCPSSMNLLWDAYGKTPLSES